MFRKPGKENFINKMNGDERLNNFLNDGVLQNHRLPTGDRQPTADPQTGPPPIY